MAKEKPVSKTNAERWLEEQGIPHEIFHYDAADGEIDGTAVAKKLSLPPEQMFKTLVAKGHSGGNYVFCIPVAETLDLKKAALAVGEKSVELLAVRELLPTTGYIRGGCSPIGMKKKFPTVLEETAVLFEHIYLSAGKIGSTLSVPPEQLAAALPAHFAPLVR